jgi:hypothetical protein
MQTHFILADTPFMKSRKVVAPLSVAIRNNNINEIRRLMKSGATLTEKNAADLHQKADDLYESVSQNAIKAYDLPDAVARIDIYHRIILQHDLLKLRDQRDKLKKNISTQTYLTQSTNPHSGLGQLSLLIAAIQSLLNFPQNAIQITNLQDSDLPEADHMLVYLERKRRINAYTENLRAPLIDLKLELQLPNTQWEIKNFFGNFVDGVPRHIEHITQTLEKISAITSADDIYEAYREIVFALSSESPGRHDSTFQFYRKHLQRLESINFNVSPLTYYQYTLQPITPTAPEQTLPINPFITLSPALTTNSGLYAMDCYAQPQTPLYHILTGRVPMGVQPQSMYTNSLATTLPIGPPPAYTNNHTYLTRTSAAYEDLRRLPDAPTHLITRPSHSVMYGTQNQTPVRINVNNNEEIHPERERVVLGW